LPDNAQNGDVMGQGVTRDRDVAQKWYKAAAEQGKADSQFFVNSMSLKTLR
jgi:TPR repeat protein